jgi:hypothetical protein
LEEMSTPSPALAGSSPPQLAPGDIVRTTREHAGVAAGSRGLFLGWYLRNGAAVVAFYNRGPRPVASNALELVEHRSLRQETGLPIAG